MKKNLRTAIWVAAASMAVLSAGGCGGSGQDNTTAAIDETIQETVPAPVGTEAETTAPAEGTEVSFEKHLETTDADYLKTCFRVELTANTWDAASFSQSLKQVAGEEVPEVTGELNWIAAIDAAVAAADFEELALSYPEDKVQQRLSFYGIAAELDPVSMANMATALDTGLIHVDAAGKAVAGEAFTVTDGTALLMAIADANGDARNYLGMSNDPDIYGKVDQMWNSFLLFDDPILSQIGKNAVLQQISTGYGIKSAAYEARFLPELTLQYGHDNIKHAHQLLGLLSSENIEAKVQLEPKISIYQYLLEWGPVPEPTPTYEVKQFDELYLVYAVEYDLQLEFNNSEDMMKFDQVILDYAKKNEGNEDAVGLIYNSWWQPLYSTTRSDMPDGYEQMYDCVVQNGIYSIHPFALPENKDTVVDALTEMAGDDAVVTPVERFCNSAFYNYLSGADYQ
ncbi:MAG: hypothetical protein ACRDBO_09915 [Lachnospiraceae bacterium]